MLIPFDASRENQRPEAVAWLRFVREEGGGGIRAALFETSAEGEPLAFRFTRAAVRNADEGAILEVADSLIRSAPHTPTLALALADEAPASAFHAGRSDGLRICLISQTESHERPQAIWAADPAPESRALLDALMTREDPAEPFRRAAACIEEAFADARVLGMMALPGIATVVSLLPPPERAGQAAVPNSAERARQADRAAPAQKRQLALYERLWAILASPARMSRRASANGAPGLPRKYEADDLFGDLMPFQKEGVGALVGMKRLLLADDMGLGKTVQAISALRLLRKRGEVRRCLVVAPASLLDQWRREMTKWAPELSAIIIRGAARERSWQWTARTDVTLVSYDTLRSDFERSQVRGRAWDVVIADEAQRVKNRNDTSRALKGLKRCRSWALTGTPIENHEEELASILEFVDHDGRSPPKRYVPGPALLSRHRELQLRRKKSEVLDDLPPKLIEMSPIDLHPKQRASYDKAEHDGIVYLRSLGEEATVQHVLEQITRLKQICNFDPETGESSKLDDIVDRLERLTAQGHRALIFSQYTNEVSGVAAAARRLRKFEPLTFTGDTPQSERAALIERFKTRDEHKALVMSLRAGGLGLNLQEASYVFHLDRWWNPAVERQAEDRSYRMGQTVKVNVIKYSCANTIEERIDRILERKQGVFDEIIDDVSLDLSTRMSRRELFGLFGLG